MNPSASRRMLLLMSPATYRAGAFLNAARGLGLEVVVGIDLPETLARFGGAEKFAQAVDESLTRLGQLLKEPEKIRQLLLADR